MLWRAAYDNLCGVAEKSQRRLQALAPQDNAVREALERAKRVEQAEKRIRQDR